MLTQEQEKWISRLSKEKVKIVSYNPKTKEVFNEVKKEIKRILGNTEVVHCGSTALGVPGQGEVDLYIPIDENSFNKYLDKLMSHFGKAGSIYPLRRARFVKYLHGIKVEIFLINKEIDDWKDCVKYENYLKNHPRALEEYVRIKEKANGLTVQDYYRKKIDFFNKIINY